MVENDHDDGVDEGEGAEETGDQDLGPDLQPLGALHLLDGDQAEDANELEVDEEDDEEAELEPDVEHGDVGDLGDDLPDPLVELEYVDEGDEGHATPGVDGDWREEEGAVGGEGEHEGGDVLLHQGGGGGLHLQ